VLDVAPSLHLFGSQRYRAKIIFQVSMAYNEKQPFTGLIYTYATKHAAWINYIGT